MDDVFVDLGIVHNTEKITQFGEKSVKIENDFLKFFGKDKSVRLYEVRQFTKREIRVLKSSADRNIVSIQLDPEYLDNGNETELRLVFKDPSVVDSFVSSMNMMIHKFVPGRKVPQHSPAPVPRPPALQTADDEVEADVTIIRNNGARLGLQKRIVRFDKPRDLVTLSIPSADCVEIKIEQLCLKKILALKMPYHTSVVLYLDQANPENEPNAHINLIIDPLYDVKVDRLVESLNQRIQQDMRRKLRQKVSQQATHALQAAAAVNVANKVVQSKSKTAVHSSPPVVKQAATTPTTAPRVYRKPLHLRGFPLPPPPVNPLARQTTVQPTTSRAVVVSSNSPDDVFVDVTVITKYGRLTNKANQKMRVDEARKSVQFIGNNQLLEFQVDLFKKEVLPHPKLAQDGVTLVTIELDPTNPTNLDNVELKILFEAPFASKVDGLITKINKLIEEKQKENGLAVDVTIFRKFGGSVRASCQQLRFDEQRKLIVIVGFASFHCAQFDRNVRVSTGGEDKVVTIGVLHGTEEQLELTFKSPFVNFAENVAQFVRKMVDEINKEKQKDEKMAGEDVVARVTICRHGGTLEDLQERFIRYDDENDSIKFVSCDGDCVEYKIVQLHYRKVKVPSIKDTNKVPFLMLTIELNKKDPENGKDIQIKMKFEGEHVLKVDYLVNKINERLEANEAVMKGKMQTDIQRMPASQEQLPRYDPYARRSLIDRTRFRDKDTTSRLAEIVMDPKTTDLPMSRLVSQSDQRPQTAASPVEQKPVLSEPRPLSILPSLRPLRDQPTDSPARRRLFDPR